MKIISWNVNGIRAIMKKGFLEIVGAMAPDILCLQETKAQLSDATKSLSVMKDFGFQYINESKARKGYSGTAILSKEEPKKVTQDMGIELHDQEGRIVTAEYADFYIINVYVPNSGQKLARLDYRKTWDESFISYIKALEKNKPVIVLGDFNVAHQEIDIARPKENYNKSAGYTQQEIDGFSMFLSKGLIDTFRELHPDEVKYSYWNYMFRSRERNVGWRIDYVLVSEQLKSSVKEAFIYNEYFGSDHCPVGVRLLI